MVVYILYSLSHGEAPVTNLMAGPLCLRLLIAADEQPFTLQCAADQVARCFSRSGASLLS